ncbi:MAG TPA: Stf0 family sulfotransferase [Methylibium sp.]|nr:Stf0 family sulfotransferase [Methylibium sp.]
MQRIPNLANVYPDVHHKHVTEHFAALPAGATARGGLALPAKLHCAYFICFVNRCGSNFVAEAMGSDGRLRVAGEELNHSIVTKQSQRLGLDSYEAYLSWLIKVRSKGTGVFGCKTSAGQLIHLYNLGLLHKLGERLRFIHVVRGDLVEQAVSMERARVTKQWTSEQPGSNEPVAYQPAALVRTMHGIQQQNATFQMLFQLMEADPLVLQYEEFVGAPARGVARIGRHIGMPDLRWRPEGVKLRKQADDESLRMRQALLNDYSVTAGRHTAPTLTLPADAAGAERQA